MLSDYKVKLGFEIHCQVLSNSKLFSYAPTPRLTDASNTWANFVDLALPGMLPVLNKECLQLALKASLALKGELNKDGKRIIYSNVI